MAIPNSSGLTTANLDQATDNPSQARADIALVIQKVRELLQSVNQAEGIVKLDADAQIEIAKLFKVGDEMKFTKKAGQGNVLAHANTPETAADVKAGAGEAITRVKTDGSGHIVRVEASDVTTLTGPFYSKWYYSHHEDVAKRYIQATVPSGFNTNILSWIPTLDEHLPSVTSFLKSSKLNNILLGGFDEEALANIAKVRYKRETLANPISTVQRYYDYTIKPYKARYVYYKVT